MKPLRHMAAILLSAVILVAGCQPNGETAPGAAEGTPSDRSSQVQTETAASEGASGSPALELAFAQQTFAPGDAFDVQVTLSSGDQKLLGAQCRVQFDPSLVRVTGVDRGDYFDAWAEANGGEVLLFPEPRINNELGEVSDLGLAVMGADKGGGAQGEGVLCTYHLEAMGASNSREPLWIKSAMVADATGATQEIAMRTGTSMAGAASDSLATGETVVIAGPWDVLPLAETIRDQAGAAGGVVVQPAASSDALEALRRGECDAALVGRPLTADEATGLHVTPVALDAVVLVIDANSYLGGEWRIDPIPGPVHRTDGLQDLTIDDVRGMIENRLRQPGSTDWVYLPTSYERWIAELDPQTGNQVKDSAGNTVGEWVPEDRPLSCSFSFPVGRYETQSILHSVAGVDEQAAYENQRIRKADGSSIAFESAPDQVREEELLAWEFDSQRQAITPGMSDFMFKIGYGSRRVVAMAIERLGVKPLRIDGIDPIADPDAVRDGRYPLSRQVLLVTTDDTASRVQPLLDYLLSTDGQQLVWQSGYLPVAP